MKPKHWNLVKDLHEACRTKVSQFLVTGGVALQLYGLVKPEEVNDVDIIIIHPTDKLIEEFRLLECMSPVKNRCQYANNLSDHLIRFELRGVNVDVFIEDKAKQALWYDYVQLQPLMELLTAKKAMGRVKDLIFVNELARQVLLMPEKEVK